MKSLIYRPLLFVLCTLLVMTSCSKDEAGFDGELSGVTVKLKSISNDLGDVYLDIKDVQLKVENSNNANSWISLNVLQETYDVSNLDTELLLVDNFEVKSGAIYGIRLVLGDNNFLNLNNILYSLDVENLGNATPSNLVNTELLRNKFYDFTIEVDLTKSLSFNESENMMVLNPKLYTEIREIHIF